jgi:hypothetical protein
MQHLVPLLCHLLPCGDTELLCSRARSDKAPLGRAEQPQHSTTSTSSWISDLPAFRTVSQINFYPL